jgi:ATPase family protein associated with various cellular activities (AAA)/winged helix domain-containing protein
MTFPALAAEWKRIECLCEIAQASRQGKETPPELMNKLEELQTQVLSARAEGAWHPLRAAGLSHLALDVLACAAAPEVSYVAAYAYGALGADPTTQAPTKRTIQALLSLEPDDVAALNAELAPDAPLRARGLVQVERGGMSATVASGRTLRQALFGENDSVAPPGAVRVRRRAGWDDLVVSSSCRHMLREFCAFIRHRDTVERMWAGRRRGGPVALFSGPSGTGKTLAALVLASDLGFPVYRVDLGQLVSKYIGETEKNLNALFDAADGSDSILLFDESDALFGRRGEVKDARDRYANMEVSHLLARIEDQRCPCILTTNLRSSIDAAFLRRFHVVVDFPMPDVEERRIMWRSHIPARAPLASGLDLDLLARHARLTGAGIENAALHAAHMAAAGEGPISMELLVQGVWRELAKDGARRALSDIGPLGTYLKGAPDANDRSARAAAAG